MRHARLLTTVFGTLGMLAAGLLVSAAPALATAPEAPETIEANPIAATTATLHGALNPGATGEAGSYDFSYEPSSSLAPECGMPGTLAPSSPVADAGAEGEAKTAGLTGLEPNEEYAFCVVAYGLSGGLAEPSYGAAVAFKTLPLAPSILSESAAPKSTDARLEGVVNPNNQATSCEFEYGTSPSLATGTTTVPCEPETLEGFGEQGVGLTVSELAQATTYYYRIIAKNASGEKTEETIKHFTTALPPETPLTEAAREITGTTATLYGELNPAKAGEAGVYEFTYQQSETECAAGSAAPEPPGAMSGAADQAVSAKLTGLEGSSEYAFCVVAINGAGETATGTTLNFKTLSSAPVIVSESSSEETPFAARLQAKVNPENQPTTCTFEYGETVTEHKAPCIQATLDGGSPQTATLSVAGLASATTYHYRVVVENATGELKGTEGEFTTLPAEAPIISSESISGLFATGVILGAEVNPNYQDTTYGFEYATAGSAGAGGTLEGTITKANGASRLTAELAELTVGVPLSGLAADTTYYYRALATNATGTTTDTVVEAFTTPVLPVVSTGSGTQHITGETATLSATVNPEGVETFYYFQYVNEARYQSALAEGASDPYAAGETTNPASAGSGTEPQAVGPTPATGLLPGTTYHYRVVAENDFEGKTETSYGQDQTFTTLSATPPTVTTGGVNGVSQDTATLSGTITTNGLQTSYGFEIATERGAYGFPTGLGSIGGSVTEAIALTLSRLQPGTTYYYRVTATNVEGTSSGETVSFTTPGFATLIPLPSSPPLIAAPSIAFPKEEAVTTITTKALTKAQKLSRALSACRKDKRNAKRAKCEAKARKQYGPGKITKKKAKKM